MVTEKLIKEFIIEKVKNIKKQIPKTEPGSIKYLLFGPQISEQSIVVKMGKVGEEMIKKIVMETDGLELLKCGVQCINDDTLENKDLDLVWVNKNTKTIYYREAKGNMHLDSEKLPATLYKIKEILHTYISPKYPEYNIDVGVFNWSIYNRDILKKGIHQIKECETKGIKVDHPEDLFKLLNFSWDKENYYSFFSEIGKMF